MRFAKVLRTTIAVIGLLSLVSIFFATAIVMAFIGFYTALQVFLASFLIFIGCLVIQGITDLT